MRLFYGPYAGAGNLSRFRNAEYDALYEKSRRTADAAERNKLYEAMTRIVSAQAPWCTNAYRISNTVVAAHIRGYRKNVHYSLTPWQYLNIDRRRRGRGGSSGRPAQARNPEPPRRLQQPAPA